MLKVAYLTMPKPLNVPWDKIRTIVEKGTSLTDVAKLYGITPNAVRTRSHREKWNTPKRVESQIDKVARLHGNRVAENASLAEQLMIAEGGQKATASAAMVDFDQATKDYRSKGVLKMARLLDSTIIAPPRTWKDYDIADKMMRRLLGIDDNEGKSNTIVSLQLVNDRLRADSSLDIIEGDFVEESVSEASDCEPLQSKLTGYGSASTESDCDTPSGDEVPSV
jgi:hypothetical protein